MPKKVGADYQKLIVPSLILIVVALIDQLTKMWAEAELIEGETYQVLGSFFQLKLIYNEGGAMGTNFGGPSFYLISAVAILIMVFYFIYANRSQKFIANSMALIAGGAVGNIIDRVQSGLVVDFLDFDFFNFSMFGRTIERWWTFNIADAAITVGIFILMFYILLYSKYSKPAESAPADNSK
ncbi:MAG: signal peptidase II [Candidatus Zixiibacteriota bacterium]|nr:MAG: signal peptidase II [candidate division Zixibacteria bacterium]HHI02389.1 signal peptidase II [candidate division Zixibacteria bacterium]